MQWIEEDGGYPYYVQPVHAKQELKYVWRVLAKQLRCMLYRRHLERTPPSASEPTPLCYEAATLRKLNLEQARLLVLGDSMIGEPDSNLIQLLCPERAQPDEPDAT